MGCIFKYPKKIWEIIYQRKRKDEKKRSRLWITQSQGKNTNQDGNQYHLKGVNQRDIFQVKKRQSYDIYENEQTPAFFDPQTLQFQPTP